jgi:hypothetical protein
MPTLDPTVINTVYILVYYTFYLSYQYSLTSKNTPPESFEQTGTTLPGSQKHASLIVNLHGDTP